MGIAEVRKRLNPQRMLLSRDERRFRVARDLENSLAVRYLRESADPEAVFTITNPDRHPFARIRARAIWDTRQEEEYVPGGLIDVLAPMWLSKQVEVSVVRLRWKGPGVKVKSGGGSTVYREPALLRQGIEDACSDPIDIKTGYLPGPRRHEKTL